MSDRVIPEAAVEAAAKVWVDNRLRPGGWDLMESMRAALEAAAPHMLAAQVAEARADHDHIIEGGDGYSAGFHYALHCISTKEDPNGQD